jgi:hypothetical protein
MPLTKWDRKERLGHGAATEIAKKLGKDQSHVSRVILGERRDREVEVAVARRIRTRVVDAFPEFYQKSEPPPAALVG